MAQPKVKNYLDCFQFLQDVYRFRKETDPQFSYQTWSTQLEVKSKSYLRYAVMGYCKISETLVLQFLNWFQFDELDQKYFVMLVQYSQTNQPESKKMYSKHLLNLIKMDGESFNVKQESPVIDDPLLFHIRDLISCKDVLYTRAQIALIFQKPVSEIDCLLKILLEYKLVVLNSDQTWSSTAASVRVTDHPNHQNLNQYHQKSLFLAIAQIEKKDVLKKYRSLNFLLSEQEFQILNDKVYDFLTEIFHQHGQGDESQGRKIYQLNYNLSPRTEAIPVLDLRTDA